MEGEAGASEPLGCPRLRTKFKVNQHDIVQKQNL